MRPYFWRGMLGGWLVNQSWKHAQRSKHQKRYLEDHPTTRKWLVSNPYLFSPWSSATWKKSHLPGQGTYRGTVVLNPVSKDDPPSINLKRSEPFALDDVPFRHYCWDGRRPGRSENQLTEDLLAPKKRDGHWTDLFQLLKRWPFDFPNFEVT